jgi:NitT/TauT family transport system substrate-binding protein
MNRRSFLAKGIGLAVAARSSASLAQSAAASGAAESIRFALDWRFEGMAGVFLHAEQAGYFAAEGLKVEISPGLGSGHAIKRVAESGFDMGFGDMISLVEYAGKFDNAPTAVMVLYDKTPAGVAAIKRTGIVKPKDLEGKVLAGPVFDAGRKVFPVFATLTGLDMARINWINVHPALRETTLIANAADAISMFYFTTVINLEAQNLPERDLTVMRFSEFGMDVYSNAIIASPTMLKTRPDAVRKFNTALLRAVKDVAGKPDIAAKAIRVREPNADEAVETRRMKMVLEANLLTPQVRKAGVSEVIPSRLKNTIEVAVASFGLKKTPAAEEVYSDRFLPVKQARTLA